MMSAKATFLITASCLGLATTATPAFAQDTQEAPSTSVADSTKPETAAASDEEIVVTGVRASLQGAQEIKRNSTQVVDSIVAEDIGKLPDNTVSDALQRVTGVQVQRGGGEVNQVLVRGLPDIETLINGREIFTGTGRGIALQDIAAELVAGLDVYKTNAPEQVEGSVSGTIDIRLRRPFDFSGLEIAGGARAFYGDKRNDWSFIGSGLVSNRWETAGGQEFGILAAASYNKRLYEDQVAFNFGFNPFGPSGALIPDTVGGLVTDGDRKRTSFNAALQWKPAPDFEIYADGLYTGYRQDFDVNFFVGLPKAGGVTITETQDGTVLFQGVQRPVARTITTVDNFTITSKQTFHQKTDGYQGNVGARWTPGSLKLSTEFTYNYNRVDSQQFVLDTAYVVPRIDYNFDIKGTPNLNFNGFDYTDTAILNLFTLFDNLNFAKSEQIAWRGDAEYGFADDGFLKNIKAGARYAHRKGSSAGTNGAGFGLGFLPSAGFPGVGGNAPDDILGGRLGVDEFSVADTDFLRSNIDELRTLAGRPTGDPAFDPTLSFELLEKVYAGYAQVGFGFDAGSMPVEGVLGVRVVNTDTTLDAIEVFNQPAPLPRIVQPVTTNSSQTNFLPSITIKARPADDVVVRFVAGKAILRPQFAQLNPATTLTQTGVTGGTGSFGTGSGGNPDLKAVKSTNIDATVEYYFSNSGSVTLAGFYKDLNGYIQSGAELEDHIASDGALHPFLVTRPQNTDKASLRGIEAAYTQFFDFLPGPLSGFGAQANFTYAKGNLTTPTGEKRAIIPLSKYSYNLVAIYEKYGFSARLAYNWRSKYTDTYSTALPGGKIVVSPLGFLDFSASYDVTDNITVTVDATNLLNETYQDSFGGYDITPRDTRRYDRTFGAGLRFRL